MPASKGVLGAACDARTVSAFTLKSQPGQALNCIQELFNRAQRKKLLCAQNFGNLERTSRVGDHAGTENRFTTNNASIQYCHQLIYQSLGPYASVFENFFAIALPMTD